MLLFKVEPSLNQRPLTIFKIFFRQFINLKINYPIEKRAILQQINCKKKLFRI